MKNCPVLYFPKEHTPVAGGVYFVLIQEDARILLKRGDSMYSGLSVQGEILRAIERGDTEFQEFVNEKQEFLDAIKDYREGSDLGRAFMLNRAAGITLVKPLHEVLEELVRSGRIPPYGRRMTVRCYPIEATKQPTWKMWLLSGKTRHCITTSGETETNFSIPAEAIVIDGESESATGAHGEVFKIVIAERETTVRVSEYRVSCKGNPRESHEEVILDGSQ